MEEKETPLPPPPDTRRWWGAWLLSTMVLPAVAGAFLTIGAMPAYIFMLMLLCASLGLHLGACFRLTPELNCLSFFLAVGGWGLIGVSYFAGCSLLAALR